MASCKFFLVFIFVAWTISGTGQAMAARRLLAPTLPKLPSFRPYLSIPTTPTFKFPPLPPTTIPTVPGTVPYFRSSLLAIAATPPLPTQPTKSGVRLE
ncbi:unnamed protein product [Ilex paraguariensis]|uniref:Uncharacterized protein n=1 Tax=Ilex paraguariensis TaxID=185542 RepID=A0ABC8U5L1_9AQUA